MNLFQSNQLGLAWWVEINTSVPHCTYYFGPFDSEREAQFHRNGYVEDLYEEKARGIVAIVKQCCPDVLTIVHDEARVKVLTF